MNPIRTRERRTDPSDEGRSFALGATVNVNGFVPSTATFSSSGEWDSQAEVEAHFAGAPVTFTHTGGEIRLHFEDSDYDDNQNGSPNSTFELYH